MHLYKRFSLDQVCFKLHLYSYFALFSPFCTFFHLFALFSPFCPFSHLTHSSELIIRKKENPSGSQVVSIKSSRSGYKEKLRLYLIEYTFTTCPLHTLTTSQIPVPLLTHYHNGLFQLSSMDWAWAWLTLSLSCASSRSISQSNSTTWKVEVLAEANLLTTRSCK